MKGIIYKWTCNINNKSYIGQTVNEKRREKDFLTENKSYAGEKINNARKKYGLSEGTWTKTVLKRLWCKDGKEDELRKKLNYWERYYIELYNTISNGYNITNGGDCDFSEEVLQEMRKRGKKYWDSLSELDKIKHREKSTEYWNSLSEEKKTELREKGTEWWNNLSSDEKIKHKEKGKKYWDDMSDEEKEKCINDSKQWWNNLSSDEKEKRILANKEKHKKWYESLTEEERVRGHCLSNSLHSSISKKGINRTEETKKKIKEKLIGCSPSMYKYVYKYSKNKSELIETYNSISEAAKSMDMKPETLVKHNKTTYKGFYWEISEIQKNTNNPEGCYFIPRINRWRSTIYYKGEKRLLGHFETPQAASAIRKMAKQKKEEGIFDEWYENIHGHKIEIFKKFGEKTCN